MRVHFLLFLELSPSSHVKLIHKISFLNKFFFFTLELKANNLFIAEGLKERYIQISKTAKLRSERGSKNVKALELYHKKSTEI